MKSKLWSLLVGVLLVGIAVGVVAQNTANYRAQGGSLWVIGGTLNASTGTTVIANGAAPPTTCTVGTIFIDTDETNDTGCTTVADNALCYCVAANTWAANEP